MPAMEKRTSAERAARHCTVRESIRDALRDGPVTTRDLSQVVGVPEHDVVSHLEHVERSLKHKGERLEIETPTCLDCGFAFTQRHRYTRPGSCPNGRSLRIALPRFRIER